MHDTQEPAVFAQKIAGYMAALDFAEDLARQNTYTIVAVEGPESHPAISRAKHFLRFRDSEDVLAVNASNAAALQAAYGSQWIGQTIRIDLIERLWDIQPIWGLQIVPLFRNRPAMPPLSLAADQLYY